MASKLALGPDEMRKERKSGQNVCRVGCVSSRNYVEASKRKIDEWDKGVSRTCSGVSKGLSVIIVVVARERR